MKKSKAGKEEKIPTAYHYLITILINIRYYFITYGKITLKVN